MTLLRPGSYVIRFSGQQPGFFTITTLASKDNIQSYRVRFVPSILVLHWNTCHNHTAIVPFHSSAILVSSHTAGKGYWLKEEKVFPTLEKLTKAYKNEIGLKVSLSWLTTDDPPGPHACASTASASGFQVSAVGRGAQGGRASEPLRRSNAPSALPGDLSINRNREQEEHQVSQKEVTWLTDGLPRQQALSMKMVGDNNYLPTDFKEINKNQITFRRWRRRRPPTRAPPSSESGIFVLKVI